MWQRSVAQRRRLRFLIMKQYTTPDQTAKLIELGFEKPKMAAPALKWVDGEPTFEPQYTIGELIEMLPHSMAFSDGDWNLCIDVDIYGEELAWQVGFIGEFFVKNKELIDALYDMIIKLKEDGVI